MTYQAAMSQVQRRRNRVVMAAVFVDNHAGNMHGHGADRLVAALELRALTN